MPEREAGFLRELGMANSDSLVYNVPKGALLYLKNHSGGVDERIFEYVDGEQVFWVVADNDKS